MKLIFKLIAKRLKSKTPAFFNWLSIIAAAVLVLFFGAEQVFDLSPYISESILNMIYGICIAIAGVAQLPVSKKSKNVDKI